MADQNPLTFNSAIQAPIKLDATNFYLWHMQLESLLIGYNLFKHVDGITEPPPETITEGTTTKPNPDFQLWRRQDHLLLNLLLSSLTPDVAPLLYGKKTAAAAWAALNDTYAKPSRARIRLIKAGMKAHFREEAMMGTITHFSHKHPLKLQPPDSRSSCELCGDDVNEAECYRCIFGMNCDFQLHSSCAKFSEKIKHLFHVDHSLVYLENVGLNARWLVCGACGKYPEEEKFRYFCMDCNYALHLKCAALSPFVELPEQKLPDVIHQHSVLECVKTPWDHFQYTCSVCRELIEDDVSICVCQICPSLMHKVCARLPTEIKHPFHLQHPLKKTLADPYTTITPPKCNACGEVLKIFASFYHCSVCRFTLDVHCAFLMPIPKTLVPGEQEDSAQQMTHQHPHPLIECHGMKGFKRYCSGCTQPFEGSSSIHVCLKSSILLDTPCIDSPLEIYHPLHPQHCLILARGYLPKCNLCGKYKKNAACFYLCKICKDFYLDLHCSRVRIIFLRSGIHKHDLVYIDFKIRVGLCNVCMQKCDIFAFRCLECDFRIHDHCHPLLPQTIKHECHCDSLTLTRSPIRDYPDLDDIEEAAEEEELYCFACEKRRELKDPTYYCAGCHFVAHVHCVLSEIIPYIEAQSRSLPENERSKKKAETYTSESKSNNEDESKETTHDTNAAEEIPEKERSKKKMETYSGMTTHSSNNELKETHTNANPVVASQEEVGDDDIALLQDELDVPSKAETYTLESKSNNEDESKETTHDTNAAEEIPEKERSKKKVETYSGMTTHNSNNELEETHTNANPVGDDDIAMLQKEVDEFIELTAEINQLTLKIDQLKQRRSHSVASLENKLLKRRN